MNRLTRRYLYGGYRASIFGLTACPDYACKGKIVDRLAEYENLNLEPEEIKVKLARLAKSDLDIKPTTDLIRQLKIIAVERRPEACLGCGFEHSCSVRGCAVINRAVELLECFK